MISHHDPSATRSTGALASLHLVADNLTERPGPALEDALNAATTCFVRHGLEHTSMRDIASELGVSKTTIYRQIGSMNDVARALVGREAHRLVDAVVEAVGDTAGPDAVLDLITAAATHICEHPIVVKVAADEPSLVSELFPQIHGFAEPITAVLTSVIEELWPVPDITSRAPLIADIAVRLVLAAIVLPPTDLDHHLRVALRPHLAV